MLDLTERLQFAASAAIADLGPSLLRDQKRIKSVLFELDLNGRGEVTSAHAWIDCTANIARMLSGPPLPAEAGGPLPVVSGAKS